MLLLSHINGAPNSTDILINVVAKSHQRSLPIPLTYWLMRFRKIIAVYFDNLRRRLKSVWKKENNIYFRTVGLAYISGRTLLMAFRSLNHSTNTCSRPLLMSFHSLKQHVFKTIVDVLPFPQPTRVQDHCWCPSVPSSNTCSRRNLLLVAARFFDMSAYLYGNLLEGEL